MLTVTMLPVLLPVSPPGDWWRLCWGWAQQLQCPTEPSCCLHTAQRSYEKSDTGRRASSGRAGHVNIGNSALWSCYGFTDRLQFAPSPHIHIWYYKLQYYMFDTCFKYLIMFNVSKVRVRFSISYKFRHSNNLIIHSSKCPLHKICCLALYVAIIATCRETSSMWFIMETSASEDIYHEMLYCCQD